MKTETHIAKVFLTLFCCFAFMTSCTGGIAATTASMELPITIEPSSVMPRTTSSLEDTPTPTLEQYPNGVTFEAIAQAGGIMQSVAVAKNVAYVGMGPRLITLDISDPAAPYELGQSELLPGVVSGVLVQNGIAYVGSGNALTIEDVRDPTTLRQMGKVILPGNVLRLVLDADTVYASGLQVVQKQNQPGASPAPHTGFLAAVNIASPEEPKLLSNITVDQDARFLALVDETLYVGGSSGQIDVVDAQDTTNLKLVEGGILLKDRIFGMYVAGNVLLTLSSDLLAYDTTTSLDQGPAWRAIVPANVPIDVTLQDGKIVVVGATIYDMYGPVTASSVTPPQRIDIETTTSASSAIAVANDLLWVVSPFRLGAFQTKSIVANQPGDAATPLEPIGAYFSPLPPMEYLALCGSSLCASHWGFYKPIGMTNNLVTLRLPDLTLLGQLRLEPEPLYVRSLAADISYAYLNGDILDDPTGLYIVSIEDPSHLTLLKWLDGRNYGHLGNTPLFNFDGITYLSGMTDVTTETLIAVDFSNAIDPQVIWQIPKLTWPSDMAADNGLVYAVTSNSSTRSIVHIIDPSQDKPQDLIQLPVEGIVNHIAVQNDLVAMTIFPKAMADTNGVLLLASAQEHTNPVILSKTTVENADQVAFMDNLLLVTMADRMNPVPGQLLAFDVSDPALPQIVGMWDTPVWTEQTVHAPYRSNLLVSGKFIILGSPSMGIYVLSIHQ